MCVCVCVCVFVCQYVRTCACEHALTPVFAATTLLYKKQRIKDTHAAWTKGAVTTARK